MKATPTSAYEHVLVLNRPLFPMLWGLHTKPLAITVLSGYFLLFLGASVSLDGDGSGFLTYIRSCLWVPVLRPWLFFLEESHTPQNPRAEGTGFLPRQKGDSGEWLLFSLSWKKRKSTHFSPVWCSWRNSLHLVVWKTLSSSVGLAAGVFSFTIICMPTCTVDHISSISLM